MTDRVLIIEEDSALRKKLTSPLTKAGFEVANAADYFEALSKLDGGKPDMVIMDEKLPGTDGWAACSELRQAFNVAIILMGWDSSSEAWMRAFEVEGVRLGKPRAVGGGTAGILGRVEETQVSESRME